MIGWTRWVLWSDVGEVSRSDTVDTSIGTSVVKQVFIREGGENVVE